jgi:hypothetical protein
MQYVSTRAASSAAASSSQQFSDILLGGLAADGGLFLPTAYPQVTGAELDAWRKLSYAELAFEILKKFATDIPEADLRALTAKTYTAEVYKNARKAKALPTSRRCACWKRARTAPNWCCRRCPTARRWPSRTWRCNCWATCSNTRWPSRTRS